MSRLTIKLRDLVKFQIYFILLIEGGISLLHIPSFFKYLVDINFMIMILWMLAANKIDFKRQVFPKECRNLYKYLIVYMLGLIMLGVLKMVPLGQIIWGVRNTFFPLFFLIICTVNLTRDDVKNIFETFFKLQGLNLFCGLYEYFVLGLQNDYLGGMFGTEKGCNGALNVYLIIICTYALSRFMNKKMNLISLIWTLMNSTVLGTLAELKVFYVELVLIVVLSVLVNRRSLKSFLILVSGFFTLFIGILVLSNVNSDSMRFLTSLEQVVEYNSVTDYGGELVISRLTSFSQIDNYFFEDQVSKKLLGYGLGGCEDSETFEWFNSGFADRYRETRYRYLTVSMNYLETGYIGLIAFLVIFIAIFFVAYKYKTILNDSWVISLVQILCVIYIVTCWYDSSIRSFVGYIMYFSLATLFICIKEKKQQIEAGGVYNDTNQDRIEESTKIREEFVF